MTKNSFMFSVEMLAEMTGGNRQYLSRKVKQLIEDPAVHMKAILKSNKEGYQIPEEEVLRCFDKISPRQIQEYKAEYYGANTVSKIQKLGKEKEKDSYAYLEKETQILMEWRFRLAATPPEKKKSPEIRQYLKQEMERISKLREEKLREYVLLEQFLSNCEKTIHDIEERLEG